MNNTKKKEKKKNRVAAQQEHTRSEATIERSAREAVGPVLLCIWMVKLVARARTLVGCEIVPPTGAG